MFHTTINGSCLCDFMEEILHNGEGFQLLGSFYVSTMMCLQKKKKLNMRDTDRDRLEHVAVFSLDLLGEYWLQHSRPEDLSFFRVCFSLQIFFSTLPQL